MSILKRVIERVTENRGILPSPYEIWIPIILLVIGVAFLLNSCNNLTTTPNVTPTQTPTPEIPTQGSHHPTRTLVTRTPQYQ